MRGTLFFNPTQETRLTATRKKPFPKKGSKAYALLNELLHGTRVDAAFSAMNLNLATLPARAAELRKLGWPVQVAEEPHPRIKAETWTVYFFDTHFRGWISDNHGKHPYDYPHQDGRGRFTEGKE